jgi:hypothetical protein
VRLSVGLEDVADLVEDLSEALDTLAPCRGADAAPAGGDRGRARACQ